MLTAIQGPRAIQIPTSLPLQAPLRTAGSQSAAELSPADSLQRTAAVGSIPATLPLFSASAPVLEKSLIKLGSSPTEETARQAQAGFRVGIRELDLNALNQVQTILDAQFKSSNDYRTQRFLAEVQVDLFMEIHAKGGKPNIPALTMPPVPGKTPEAILHGSLKQLNCCPTEANYQTARAGFRVALRSLSTDDLAKTRQLVQAATQTSGDYRTQRFLDNLLEDVMMEQFAHGVKPDPQSLQMPPALGKAPAEIAVNAVKLLNCCPTEVNFRTSVAAVRVAARSLDKAQLAALKAEFTKLMAANPDYRNQVFLDTVAREIY